jgi:type I restriction enzyme S subunit
MSFPRYPAYKPSGVEWLGEVPEHWEVKRMASLYSEVVEAGNEDLPVLSVSIHHGVSDSELSEEEMDRKVVRSDDRSKYKRVAPGDLVYNMMRAWQGAFGSVVVEGMVSPAYVVARPKTTLPTEWIEYLLRTEFAVNEIKRFSRGITDFRLRLYWDEFKNLRICSPPAEERASILRFLNRETAKIDALIAEQQRLIELLQEKRQAVISHAVTKSLNPDAPMKDSGVEWLGEVPEHWRMTRVKHLCECIEQGWSPQCENESSDGDAPGILKVGCVNGGTFRPSENKRLPPGLNPIPQYSVRRGDLLVSRANTKELVGSAAVAEEDYPWLYICDKLYRITVEPGKSTSNYLALYLRSNEARGQLELGASGASHSMQNISQSVLMEMPIPLPEPDEQERIIDAVSDQCTLLDRLRANAIEAIELFQERRSALISAAVTGQIDVRGLAPEADAA